MEIASSLGEADNKHTRGTTHTQQGGLVEAGVQGSPCQPCGAGEIATEKPRNPQRLETQGHQDPRNRKTQTRETQRSRETERHRKGGVIRRSESPPWQWPEPRPEAGSRAGKGAGCPAWEGQWCHRRSLHPVTGDLGCMPGLVLTTRLAQPTFPVFHSHVRRLGP